MSNIELSSAEKGIAKSPLAGAGSWLKNHLFNNWLNSFITVVTAVVSFYILYHVARFVFITADWTVISDNFRLLMVGQFPVAELWRVWTGLILLSILLGTSAGLWKGTMAHITIALGGIMAIAAAMPFILMITRILLIVNILLIVATYFFGKKIAVLKKPIITLWVLLIPIVIFILNGFGGIIDPVRTNVWGGFLLTLLIASVAIVCSFPLGVLLALGRRSKLPVIKWFCILYIEVIRGVPLITVLFIGQLMIPMLLGGVHIDNVLRAMIGFTMFSAAYLAENVRGGLQALPRGQYEAAHALGFKASLMMLFIILPQALRTVIPAMVGQFIGIFKDTSLVAIVGLIDLLGMGQRITANPDYLGKQIEVYLFVALFYFIFCYLMAYSSRRLEKSLGVGTR
ncbi:amino acid ABC transporter permease [Bacillaceae bacterium Marseille-Q3522]|nr:amino acid ABC transporter permease [Bacillaceae bacterium Marseille-Q3522]